MTFVLALLVFMAIMAAMAVGVIFGRGPIKGSYCILLYHFSGLHNEIKGTYETF